MMRKLLLAFVALVFLLALWHIGKELYHQAKSQIAQAKADKKG